MEILLTYKNLACIIFTDLIQLHLRTSKIKFIIIITPRKQTQITSKGGEIMEKVENIILLEIKNLQKDVSNLDKKIDKKLSQMKKEILQEMDIRLKEIEEKFDKKLEERISQNTKEISQEITEVIKYICERYDNKIEDKVKKENKQNKALHNEYNSRMYKIELSQANIEEKIYDLEHEKKKIS